MALLLCSVVIIYEGVFFYPKWKEQRTEATISWDVSGYYFYLPAIFIYKDVRKLNFKGSILEKYQPTPDFQQATKVPSGNSVLKYSSGQAIMYSPFFFIAHFIALNSGKYAADGFSYPYQLSIGIGMLLYAFLGLFILRKILLEFYPDKTVALALLCICLGSNYLSYAAIDGAMTHNTLFALYTLLIYFTIAFYRKPKYSYSLAIGFLIGLATITRPTEIISVIIPLLWGIASKEDLKKRFEFFIRNKRYLLVASFAFLALLLVQMTYWKMSSGQWIFYSYRDDGFDWFKPHLQKCLIGYNCGWLTYSPIMILSVIGFVVLYRSKKALFWACLSFSVIFTYLCFAWHIWWYGGSLGQRAMIQSYPVLAFPLASFIYKVQASSKSIFKIILYSFIGLCILYNLWLTRQAHANGLFRSGEMNKEYFWAILGKNGVGERTQFLLDDKDIYLGNPTEVQQVYKRDFDTDTTENLTQEEAISNKSIFLDKQFQYSDEYFFSLTNTNRKWVRATADFKATLKEWDIWKMTQFIIRFYQGDKMIQSNSIKIFRLLTDGETKTLSVDASIPKHFDKASVIFWNAGGDKKIIIDNLKIIAFNK
jgi:hypothetical protein